MWEISTVAWIMEMTIICKNYANINWVQQALSKFLFVFMFFSLVLAVTNEPPPVLQSSFCVKTLIIFLSNNTGPHCTGQQQLCSHLQRSWYRWMRSVIFEWRQGKPWSHQSIFAGPDRPVLSWSIDINLIKIVQLHIPQLQQYWNSSILPGSELLSTSFFLF